MDTNTHNAIVSFIWSIADEVLRDHYVRSKYRDVILPMTVIRRLDVLLEPTKQKVLETKKRLDKDGLEDQDALLRRASGEAFYNKSPFTLKDLRSKTTAQRLQTDFKAYLRGFSPNVQDILSKFKFHNQIPQLVEQDLLGPLIEKYLSPRINLSPKPVLDEKGNEIMPGLDNHSMGTVFEELIRRFNEENNEEAGEHFTPRDVVTLMADLIFLPIQDQITKTSYHLYDGACGTGGMLTVAEERLQTLAKEHEKQVSTHLYGQEIQPETYAITKADLLLKGEGEEAENIRNASTLSDDAFASQKFDFMLSNPPYGKSWGNDLNRLGGKDGIIDPRFIVQHGGDPEYRMVTRVSDGQLMFLVNKLMKMKTRTQLGSRIAHIHNGSSLFTGDAGQGESNIRRWIIENDWLEAIIALPKNIFYNTGIDTYVWLLTNKKADKRKGKVQLIDATQWYQPLRKNMGAKNCELSEQHIDDICHLIMQPNIGGKGGKMREYSKVFPNDEFGYYKITVERPLRRKGQFSSKALDALYESDERLYTIAQAIAPKVGKKAFMDYNEFRQKIDAAVIKADIKATDAQKRKIALAMSVVDETAAPVIKKVHKAGKIAPDPLYGRYEQTIDGKKAVVEYEADTALRDSEQVPLLEEGGIAGFMDREVFPYNADAWVDENQTKIGYEISFTKHFYKPTPMRTLDEIKDDILAIEKETEGLLHDIIEEAETPR